MPTFTTHPLTNLVFFLALLTSAWSCTSSRLSEKGKSDGKSAQKDESETSTSTSTSSGAASEVPPWTDMVDASQVGLAPTDAESSSSQPSTQVSGTNLTENSATIADPSTVCAALDVMGALAIPNKLACLASRTVRATLYADHLPASGAAAISCSTYVPGERNGILMDVSCRDIYRDRDQMTQAKDLKAGSDSLYDIFRFDRFDQTRPAVGSWTAAGPALGRYPAQMRYWTGADGAKRPVISLATDGGRYAKGYFDSEPLGGAVRGEYLKSLVDDGSGCRAKPGINNCVEQSAKVVLPGDAAQSMSFHTLSDRPSAPSFLLFPAQARCRTKASGAKDSTPTPQSANPSRTIPPIRTAFQRPSPRSTPAPACTR